MVLMTWTTVTHDDIGAALTAHSADPLCGGLISWARDCVDTLYYLADHDSVVFQALPITYRGHNASVINVAHVRWASSTAITALDLCAAALARIHAVTLGLPYMGSSVDHEASLRQFESGGKFKRQRRLLPTPALAWCDQVLNDSDYRIVLKARHPLVHGRHPRVLQAGTGNSLPRDDFAIDGPNRPSTPASDLVGKSRDMAARYVDDFLVKTANSLVF